MVHEEVVERMRINRFVIGAWLAGAAVFPLLSGQVATAAWKAGPFGLLRYVLFWPLVVLESFGEQACAHGCSNSLLVNVADLIDGLLPQRLLDTLTYLIISLAVAWAIVRWRRSGRGRELG